ncbi:MAG: NAD-dependent epimerase/dehydratase family protein [Acidimicrobiales bacterium]
MGDAVLSGMRVLVTGAAGFIGAALCRRLLADGADVHGVSRTPRDSDHLRWLPVDLADPGPARRVVDDVGPDVVFHLASHVSGDRSLEAVGPTLRDNLLTTVNLLTAATESGRPLVVLAGSMEAWGPGDPDPVPNSPYAAAKAAATAYARMFGALYDLPVVSLRLAMVYGPGQLDTTKLVPYVTTSLLRAEPPRLTSGARGVDWVYIDDAVDAFMAAATSAQAAGSTIDVGSGELVTIRALVEQIAALVGGDVQPIFGALGDRPLERQRVADVAAARELLGWAPTTPLGAGLARTVAWYRGQLVP